MDAETGKIVAVATVVVVGIILAATCDYLMCGKRDDESQALREFEDALRREFEDDIRECEDVIRKCEEYLREFEDDDLRENEIHREIVKAFWRRGKKLNLSTCQKIKLF